MRTIVVAGGKEYVKKEDNEFAPLFRTSVIDGKRYEFTAFGMAILLDDNLEPVEIPVVNVTGSTTQLIVPDNSPAFIASVPASTVITKERKNQG